MILLVVAVGVLVYLLLHKILVEGGQDGLPFGQAILEAIDGVVGTHFAPVGPRKQPSNVQPISNTSGAAAPETTSSLVPQPKPEQPPKNEESQNEQPKANEVISISPTIETKIEATNLPPRTDIKTAGAPKTVLPSMPKKPKPKEAEKEGASQSRAPKPSPPVLSSPITPTPPSASLSAPPAPESSSASTSVFVTEVSKPEPKEEEEEENDGDDKDENDNSPSSRDLASDATLLGINTEWLVVSHTSTLRKAARRRKYMVWPGVKATIGKFASDFTTIALVDGEYTEVKLSDYEGKYIVLFFWPLDFTVVCPTEIIAFSERVEDFRAVNCQILGCSADSHHTHYAWTQRSRKEGGLGEMNFPLLSDVGHHIARAFGVLKEDEGLAFRALFIIDADGIVRNITVSDLPVGCSVEETLRLVSAFQYADEHGEICPAGWKPGQETIKPTENDPKLFFEKLPTTDGSTEC